LFFSTTDLKGRIQPANSVFERIAGYSWDQLANKPHNIIRHPDMPSIVFQLLWDYVQDGRPIVPFVELGAGGELKAVEATIESDANDRKASIRTSREALGSKLRSLGFSSYNHFMQYALKLEMQSREQYLRAFCPPVAELNGPNHSAELHSLRPAAKMFDKLVEVLNVLFADLEVYAHINTGVRAKSVIVTDRAESLRVSALNGSSRSTSWEARLLACAPYWTPFGH
jgi:aerotaxis receptor